MDTRIDPIDDDRPDEADLLDRCREGDRDAFDLLFRSYHAGAVKFAAHITGALDPEDLASEAFARTWSALRGGGGPDQAFGPYLRTTIRNIATNTATRSREEASGDDQLEHWMRRETRVSDDGFSSAMAEHEVVAEAFGTLPPRWQSVLWAIDVEGRPTSDVARGLDLTPNSTAALTKRARAALSRAWLQAHVETHAGQAECEWVLAHIGGFVRHSLSRAQDDRVRAHLDQCSSCERATHRISHLAVSLRIAAFVGAGSAAAFAATLIDPTSAAAAGGASFADDAGAAQGGVDGGAGAAGADGGVATGGVAGVAADGVVADAPAGDMAAGAEGAGSDGVLVGAAAGAEHAAGVFGEAGAGHAGARRRPSKAVRAAVGSGVALVAVTVVAVTANSFAPANIFPRSEQVVGTPGTLLPVTVDESPSPDAPSPAAAPEAPAEERRATTQPTGASSTSQAGRPDSSASSMGPASTSSTRPAAPGSTEPSGPNAMNTPRPSVPAEVRPPTSRPRPTTDPNLTAPPEPTKTEEPIPWEPPPTGPTDPGQAQPLPTQPSEPWIPAPSISIPPRRGPVVVEPVRSTPTLPGPVRPTDTPR